MLWVDYAVENSAIFNHIEQGSYSDIHEKESGKVLLGVHRLNTDTISKMYYQIDRYIICSKGSKGFI